MAVDKVIGPVMAGDTGTGGAVSESAVLVYEVSFTTNAETAVDALTADDGTTSIPENGDQHPDDSTLRVQKKQAVRLGSSPLYRVTVNYGTNSTTGRGDAATSPLLRPTRWNEDPRGGSVDIDTQADGKLLLTSAGETVVTQIPYSDKTITATKNSASRVDYDAKYNRVNDDTYQGYAAKRLLLTGVPQRFTEELYEGEVIQYYQQTFTFLLNIPRTSESPSTWEQRIVNEGTVELDDGDKTTTVRDKGFNTPITSFTKLDADGKALAPGGTPLFLNNNPNAPTAAGKVDVFLTADFDTLGL